MIAQLHCTGLFFQRTPKMFGAGDFYCWTLESQQRIWILVYLIEFGLYLYNQHLIVPTSLDPRRQVLVSRIFSVEISWNAWLSCVIESMFECISEMAWRAHCRSISSSINGSETLIWMKFRCRLRTAVTGFARTKALRKLEYRLKCPHKMKSLHKQALQFVKSEPFTEEKCWPVMRPPATLWKPAHVFTC